MRAPVSRSRPLRPLAGTQQRHYSVGRLVSDCSPARPPGVSRVDGRDASWRERTCRRAGLCFRCGSGLKRDVVARPGRRQCHVSVLGTADRRQAGRDERLERHHVRLAPGAFRELDGLARAPALWAWESRTCPGAETQIDSSAFEVDIAAHHAPRRLKLQRKLEELLHAPDRDAVGHRPGMVSARPRRAVANRYARARITARAILGIRTPRGGRRGMASRLGGWLERGLGTDLGIF